MLNLYLKLELITVIIFYVSLIYYFKQQKKGQMTSFHSIFKKEITIIIDIVIISRNTLSNKV